MIVVLDYPNPGGDDVPNFMYIPQTYRWNWMRPFVLMFGDFAAIVLACVLLNILFLFAAGTVLISRPVIFCGSLFFIFVAELSNLYHESLLVPGLISPPQEELRRIFWIIVGLLLIRLFYFREFPLLAKSLGHGGPASIPLKAGLVFGMFPVVFFSVILFRWLARHLMFIKNIGVAPVVILGAGKTGQVVARVLKKSKHFGLKPIGFFDDRFQRPGEALDDLPVLGSLADYYENQASLSAAIPILCLPLMALQLWGKRIYLLKKRAYIASTENFFPSTGAGIYDLHGLTVLGLKNNLNIPSNLRIQKVLNLFIGFLATAVFLLPMAVVALLVRVTSPGPVIYFATRLGQDGKEITIPKFRTMYEDAEDRLHEILENSPESREEWEAHFKLRDDPRVTPVGRFLRKTSLDELPQLFSVLKGDMNLVGPRPIVADEIPKFGESFEFISTVKPGLTGMWQVSGRSGTSYDERVFLETYYIRNWSLWLDLYILLKTTLEVVLCRGAY